VVSNLITLTTDFGYKDPFAGTMKGVILGINPSARIVDLTHGIPAQDIMAGALAVAATAPFFPRGTIHVAVVDPGVGSGRRAILVESEGFFFVGPDNGVFSLALNGKKKDLLIELSNETFHLQPTSSTFHGRDIFAPTAAHLTLGVRPQELGDPVKVFQELRWPEIKHHKGTLRGEVVYIDGFGNLITNVSERVLEKTSPKDCVLSLGDLTIQGLVPSYSHGEKKQAVALINSWGLLEVSVFKGNAHRTCGAEIGDKVTIRDGRVAP
jgi:S-adenosylmethionine hydrolase